MPKFEFMKVLKRVPLFRRVFFYTFCIGLGMATVWTLAAAIWQYQSLRENVLECVGYQTDVVVPSLAEVLSRQDIASASEQLRLMQHRCREINGILLPPLYLSLQLQKGEPLVLGAYVQSFWLLRVSYPVNHWQMTPNDTYWLGELEVVQDLAGPGVAVLRQNLWLWLSLIVMVSVMTLVGVVLAYVLVVMRLRGYLLEFKRRGFNETARRVIQNEESEVVDLWKVFLKEWHALEQRYEAVQDGAHELAAQRDKAQRDSEAKSQFLTKMSHELRNPMSGLLGFSALLLESDLSPEQREYAQTIQVSLETMLHIVNDILDLSRIESGDLHIAHIPFSVRSVISGVSTLVANRAESKGLAFETRISPDMPQTLRGDPARLRQILLNLATNAIEQTDKGYVFIDVEVLARVDGECRFRMAVEDTGSGAIHRGADALDSTQMDAQKAVQKEQQKNLAPGSTGFSSEFRERRSIGLDMCYQLADLMRAKIGHEFSGDRGATFWLEISLPIINQTANVDSIDLGLTADLNVLVVDSYELSRKITLELLQEWRIRFEAVNCAEEAIRLIKKNDLDNGGFNMVLCDDLLQDLSGHELCARIRQLGGPGLRVVVLSTNPQLGDAESFFLSGAHGFLSKQHRDPYLRLVMCQVYAERHGQAGNSQEEQLKRLVTRYTVSEATPEGGLELYEDRDKRGRILVVEDNIVNQQLAVRMLQKTGYQVDVAVNGFEAIELFKSCRYDLIFMDCLMPDMDGYETTQILRELERSGKVGHRTPIIALTAHAIEGEAERCFRVGMDEVITKPFKLSQLALVLGRYIGGEQV